MGSFWAQRPFFNLFIPNHHGYNITTAIFYSNIGWNLVYIIQLKKMKKMFSVKSYSLGLLLKNVNRNIRSWFPESIAYFFEFWRTACRNTNTIVWCDWSTESGHQRRWHLVGSVSVPVTVVWAGWFLSQQQAMTCGLMSNAVIPATANCTQQAY